MDKDKKLIQCNRITYKTKEEADTALSELRGRFFFKKGKKVKGPVKQSYRCKRCGFFHLTTRK